MREERVMHMHDAHSDTARHTRVALRGFVRLHVNQYARGRRNA